MQEHEALSAFFPLRNIAGIEINAFAVSLARVTLWMGHKLAVDELGLSESTLPLEDLDRIQAGDALRTPWPRCDVIVSNPPFHGDRNLRGLLGDAYVEWLKEEFKCGVKDHCVYWFRKAHDHLEPGQRAGMVGTNSISQNRGRGASLNYLVENDGVITDAISSQDWPGAANVDVSIVNWIKGPLDYEPSRVLDQRVVEGIDTALRPSTIPIADVPSLEANRGFAFQGYLPGAKFDISSEVAEELLARGDAPYAEVALPYLDGRDIARTVDQKPTRFTIDFGQMTLRKRCGIRLRSTSLESRRKQRGKKATLTHATLAGGSFCGLGRISGRKLKAFRGSLQDRPRQNASSLSGAMQAGGPATARTRSPSTATMRWLF